MKDLTASASSSLPASAGSLEGASGGSLGELSTADTKRGYSVIPCTASQGYQCDCPECTAMRRPGFLGRPDPYMRDDER